jgi:cytochrome c
MNPQEIPIPRNIPLSLPAQDHELQFLLILSFLLHILFVNLMIGGSLYALVFEYLGQKKSDYDKLAREIVSTITVNKSMAVVLGVAPLLTINVYYTIYFYTANSLTGLAWIMIVPLVTIAFLLGYAHKYSWDILANQKGLHMCIGASATILFFIIPLIFLSNINLMLFPDRWMDVHGWLSTLVMPNVIPRYFHFILGTLAVSALFFAGYFSRKGYPVEEKFESLTRPQLRQIFYTIALVATGANFLAGPLLYITLPSQGQSLLLFATILCGVIMAIIVATMLWKDIVTPERASAYQFYVIIALMTGTVIMMASGRHIYRENAIDGHRVKMAEATQTYQSMLHIAQWRESQGLSLDGSAKMSPGEKVFKFSCASCHALDKRLVGPPLTEIYEEYKGNPAGITKWVKNPGKKRADYPPMPPIRMSDTKYAAVSQYVLDLVESGGKKEEETAQEEVQE